MNNRKQVLKYLVTDFLAAIISWTCFYIYRKSVIETEKFGYEIPLDFTWKFYTALVILPFFWILLFYTSGHYKNIFRRSRLKELWQTLSVTILGVIVLFFTLILDDTILDYKQYYSSLFMLTALQFLITYIPRLIITSRTIKLLRNRNIGFNTLIVGSNEKAVELFLNFEAQPKSSGNKFIGFVKVLEDTPSPLEKHLPKLGSIEFLRNVIKEHHIEEVIIAIETSENEKVNRIINTLHETNVIIKVIPTMYDILTGAVNMSTIYGAPLIEISHDIMPAWQQSMKRLIDIVASCIVMILLFPVYVFLAVGVKLSSKGPIFYSQERIGMYGKPFQIYKFRSMYTDAEKKGPQLSSKNDSRITPFGLFMRRSRLDEVPQFYNVLRGDMSLVGPRPERQHFIDLIVQQAPHYYHLHKVRPGITSWGQVKYGYAENVEEMIARLKYDLIYIENMSLYVDFKIMIYTIKTVLKGLGK